MTKSGGVGRGWRGDGLGHALAARGIKSRNRRTKKEQHRAQRILNKKMRELEERQRNLQKQIQEAL